jgi:hypothetical protein
MPGAAHFTDIVRDDPLAVRLGVLVNFPEWHLLPPSSATHNNYGSVGPGLAHRPYTQGRNLEMQCDQPRSLGSLVPVIENNGKFSLWCPYAALSAFIPDQRWKEMRGTRALIMAQNYLAPAILHRDQ